MYECLHVHVPLETRDLRGIPRGWSYRWFGASWHGRWELDSGRAAAAAARALNFEPPLQPPKVTDLKQYK